MNQPFDFTKLSLLRPNVTSGGNYFIKFRMNENPLYIQSPKCKTKQGIYKSGKKFFCDLIFTNEHESFIQWMDNLENHSRKIIYENKSKWFETELDENDIENSFTSPLKWVKSGKYYICRVNIPTQLGNCSLKIYNEDEQEISIDSIQENQNVLTILEIQGIKCSARSFQIEIEIKQMLVMKPDNLFDRCIFKPTKISTRIEDTESIIQGGNTDIQVVKQAIIEPVIEPMIETNDLVISQPAIEEPELVMEEDSFKEQEESIPENNENISIEHVDEMDIQKYNLI